MEEGSLLRSLDRIESAIARIEAAAQMRAASAPAHPDMQRDDHATDLDRRHAALKVAVAQTLARLDHLIAEQA
jgi:hypothetical protein